jgi:hypothetical protein
MMMETVGAAVGSASAHVRALRAGQLVHARTHQASVGAWARTVPLTARLLASSARWWVRSLATLHELSTQRTVREGNVTCARRGGGLGCGGRCDTQMSTRVRGGQNGRVSTARRRLRCGHARK